MDIDIGLGDIEEIPSDDIVYISADSWDTSDIPFRYLRGLEIESTKRIDSGKHTSIDAAKSNKRG